MGYSRATGMALAAKHGTISRETALLDHFTANMHPPVPLAMIPTANDAINLAVEGQWDETLRVPDMIQMQSNGKIIKEMTVREAIERLRLEGFVAVEKEVV